MVMGIDMMDLPDLDLDPAASASDATPTDPSLPMCLAPVRLRHPAPLY